MFKYLKENENIIRRQEHKKELIETSRTEKYLKWTVTYQKKKKPLKDTAI